MPGCFVRFAVSFDIWGELRQCAKAHRDEHAVTELADGRERVGAVGGDTNFGPRLLIRLWSHSDILERVVFARIGKRVFSPRPLQYVQGLGKTLAAFPVG